MAPFGGSKTQLSISTVIQLVSDIHLIKRSAFCQEKEKKLCLVCKQAEKFRANDWQGHFCKYRESRFSLPELKTLGRPVDLAS